MAERKERKDRGWRGNILGRPPIREQHYGTIHENSEIIVEGRSPEINWNNTRRNELDAFIRLATGFGLMVHELVPRTKRVRRTTGPVDLDLALAHIADDQGMFFDDWVRRVYLGKHPENDTTFAGAAQTARAAMSRLYRSGRIEKVKTEEGRIRLYTIGHAPKREKDL